MAVALDNKVAIITGGSRDIGKAISLKLAASGYKVVVNYNSNKQAAEDTLQEIRTNAGNAIAIQADVTKHEDVQNLVTRTTEHFGKSIAVLVNVAGGIVERRTISEMDELFLNQVMALNLNSTFLMTKEALPYMSEGSSIINIASQAGRDGGGPGAAAYATSKGAVMTFTRSMAKELGTQGIRVNAVCPGMIATKFHDKFTHNDTRKKVAASTPLQREGASSEVADLVAYLASPQASFIQGACIDINGGLFFS